MAGQDIDAGAQVERPGVFLLQREAVAQAACLGQHPGFVQRVPVRVHADQADTGQAAVVEQQQVAHQAARHRGGGGAGFHQHLQLAAEDAEAFPRGQHGGQLFEHLVFETLHTAGRQRAGLVGRQPMGPISVQAPMAQQEASEIEARQRVGKRQHLPDRGARHVARGLQPRADARQQRGIRFFVVRAAGGQAGLGRKAFGGKRDQAHVARLRNCIGCWREPVVAGAVRSLPFGRRGEALAGATGVMRRSWPDAGCAPVRTGRTASRLHPACRCRTRGSAACRPAWRRCTRQNAPCRSRRWCSAGIA